MNGKTGNGIYDKLMHVCMKIKAKQYISSKFFNSHTNFYAREKRRETNKHIHIHHYDLGFALLLIQQSRAAAAAVAAAP